MIAAIGYTLLVAGIGAALYALLIAVAALFFSDSRSGDIP
jgi:hypothetical protein